MQAQTLAPQPVANLLDGALVLEARIGHDALVARLESEARSGFPLSALRASGPGVIFNHVLSRAATARAILAGLDGGADADAAQVRRHAADVLAEMTREADPGRAMETITSEIKTALAVVARGESAILTPLGGRDDSTVGTIRGHARAEARKAWLAERGAEMDGAVDGFRDDLAKRAGGIIDDHGGVDALADGLAAIENARNPIDRALAVAAVAGLLADAEAALAAIEPGAWGAVEAEQRVSTLRASLQAERDAATHSRRSVCAAIARAAHAGTWAAVDRLISALDGATASQAKALHADLSAARREALVGLAPAWAAAIEVNSAPAE